MGRACWKGRWSKMEMEWRGMTDENAMKEDEKEGNVLVDGWG